MQRKLLSLLFSYHNRFSCFTLNVVEFTLVKIYIHNFEKMAYPYVFINAYIGFISGDWDINYCKPENSEASMVFATRQQ